MSRRAVPALVLGILVAALSLPVSLSAQTSYHATVLDSSRAPIAGATVTATPVAGGAAVTAVTDQRGEFALALPAGTFTVTIESVGFRLATQRVNASRPGDGAAGIRAAGRGVPGDGERERPQGLQRPGHFERHAHVDAAARRAAVGHGHHAGTDARPADDEHRRRRALRAGHRRPPGREQPRRRGDSRQPLLGRLLPQRHPRRRAVLPRPLQPRSRRGAEGAQRPGLRPRQRRRRHQPGGQGSRVHAGARVLAPGRRSRQPPLQRRPRSAARQVGGVPRQRDARRQRQLPRRREPRARRVQPDAHRHGHQPHQAHLRLRAPARRAGGRPRHHLVPGPSGRRRHRHLLRQPARQPRRGARQHRHDQHRAPRRPCHPPEPHADRRLRPLLPELRPRRGQRRRRAW